MSHTLPAHVSLMTGVHPAAHRVLNNRWKYSGRYPTLAQQLSGRGYATGAFVSGLPLQSGAGLSDGFEVYEDTTGADGEVAVRLPGEAVTERAIAWLETPRDGPFFLFVHYFDTHAPYDGTRLDEQPFRVDAALRERMDRLGISGQAVDEISRTPIGVNGVPAELPELINAYDNQIHRVDGLIAQLLEALEDTGAAERTLLIVTSDHGEGLGQHGYYWHGMSLYEEQLHVPLIVRPPAGSAWTPGRIAQPVSLLDIAPTVLDVVGAPAQGFSHGRPLPLDLGRPQGSSPRWLVAQRRYFMKAARARGGRFTPSLSLSVLRGPDSLKFMRSGDGAEELYDLATDPSELHDLAPERREELAGLRARLDAAIEERTRDAPIVRQELDAETERMLETLGYAR